MNDQVLTALAGALVIVVPALTGFVVQWLRTQTTLLKKKANNADLDIFIDLAENTVETVVQSLNQTTVEAAKQSSTNGKLTDEQITQYTNEALNNVLDILSDDCKKGLDMAFANSEAWLQHKIQEAVKNAKAKINK